MFHFLSPTGGLGETATRRPGEATRHGVFVGRPPFGAAHLRGAARGSSPQCVSTTNAVFQLKKLIPWSFGFTCVFCFASFVFVCEFLFEGKLRSSFLGGAVAHTLVGGCRSMI